jgi:hypothetical protein
LTVHLSGGLSRMFVHEDDTRFIISQRSGTVIAYEQLGAHHASREPLGHAERP